MGNQNVKILPRSNKIRFSLNFKNPRLFCFVLQCMQRENVHNFFLFFFSENFILVWWFELSNCVMEKGVSISLG